MGKNKFKNRGRDERRKVDPELIFINNILDFPEEIMMNILVRIPPKDVEHSVKHVCRAWLRLIESSEFIRKNADSQNLGIVTQLSKFRLGDVYSKPTFLQIDESKLDIKQEVAYYRSGRIRSSCNGVVLICDLSCLVVENMLTSCSWDLLSCPSGCQHLFDACSVALGFDPATNKFKVVHMYADGYGFEMFTVGFDTGWRRIPGPFKSSNERPFNIEEFRWSDPVSTSGGRVLHWFVDSDKYVVSMEIGSEQVSKTSLPCIGKAKIKKHNYDLVEMGGRLCFVYKGSSCQIDVWVLKELGEEQVWSKKHIIKGEHYPTYSGPKPAKRDKHKQDQYDFASQYLPELKDKLPNFSKLAAVATLRNGEVMLLMHKKNSNVYLYDFKHEKVDKLKMKVKKGQRFIPHKSSLWCPVGAIEFCITLRAPFLSEPNQ